MKKVMLLSVGLLVLFASAIWAQIPVVPETSADGAVTVDGDLSDAAWANALDMPAIYHDKKSGGQQFYIQGDRTNTDDLTVTFKLMYQGQKFYIGCIITDNELCIWNDPLKDLPEAIAYGLSNMWKKCTWNQDGIEMWLNLNGAPHSGGPTISGIGAGESHTKIGLDPLYEPSIKPEGQEDRWWNFVDIDKVSILLTYPTAAFIGLDINEGANTYQIEYCIDMAELSPSTPLAGGNHIAFIGYYKDLDTNTNATGGLETPYSGGAADDFCNLTGYLTTDLNIVTQNPTFDASLWQELVLEGGTGIDEWRLF